MKTAQVAKLINVSPTHLYEALAKRGGELPRNKSNRQYIWTDEAIAVVRSWFHGEVPTPDNPAYPALIKNDATIELLGTMSVTPVEQPAPVRGDVVVYPHLVTAIMERVSLGLDHYGTPLMTNNGRKTLRDIRDELIDAALYMTQLMLEQDMVTK